MKPSEYRPRPPRALGRRLQVLVLDEGPTLNCNLFRGADDHDYEFLDCDKDRKDVRKFRNQWATIKRKIRAGAYDVGVVTDRGYSFWRTGTGPVSAAWRWLRAALYRPWRIAHLAVPMAMTRRGIPWALVDRNDQSMPREGNHLFFRDCTAFFVRELLANRFEIFPSYRRGEPGCRLWPRGGWVDYPVEKIRPIGLGLQYPEGHFAGLPTEKKHDIFFCGTTALRYPRMSAVAELEQAAPREGWRFFRAGRISAEGFLQACAQSWLVLSPSGNGWDCWRHAEALMAGSVPLINYPWVERYAPLRDGEHAFFYSPEGGHLTETVRRALANKERLRVFSREGRRHVLTYHTYSALRGYLLAETLRMASTPAFSSQAEKLPG